MLSFLLLLFWQPNLGVTLDFILFLYPKLSQQILITFSFYIYKHIQYNYLSLTYLIQYDNHLSSALLQQSQSLCLCSWSLKDYSQDTIERDPFKHVSFHYSSQLSISSFTPTFPTSPTSPDAISHTPLSLIPPQDTGLCYTFNTTVMLLPQSLYFCSEFSYFSIYISHSPYLLQVFAQILSSSPLFNTAPSSGTSSPSLLCFISSTHHKIEAICT